MSFKLQCTEPFFDTINQVWRSVKEEFDCETAERAHLICDTLHYGKLHEIKCENKTKKTGAKIIIYQSLLYVIGGIETWDYNVAKLFPNADITFVFTDANFEQAERLSRYHDVVIDNGETEYNCDVFISANYYGADIIMGRVKAKKYYQMVHSDFSQLAKFSGWKGFQFPVHPRIDKVLSASETAQKGLKKACNIDSTVLTNPLAPLDKNDRPLVFMSMTRASVEKGIARMVQMIALFRAHHKNFVWFVCATLENTDEPDVVEKLRSFPEVIVIQPSIYSQKLMWLADYGVQLSDTESYCYSIREFLQRKIPCICTDFDEAKKIIKPGENGYLVDMALSNLDVDKIFNKIPKMKTAYGEKLDPKWEQLLKGEL